MMTGEFEYEANFLWEGVEHAGDLGTNGTTQIVFILFIFVVSIVIVNLIIGLTVSETDKLQRTADATRLERTLVQILSLEELFVEDDAILRVLPSKLKSVLTRGTQIFPYLKSEQCYGHQYKICVRPFETARNNFSWRKCTPLGIASIFYNDHLVYLYSESECSVGARLTRVV